MNQLKLTRDDVVRIITQKGNASLKMKVKLFQQLMEDYYQDRSFNMYQDLIWFFYAKPYSLGRTKMKMDEKLPITLKFVDTIVKHEKDATDELPTEHAKYMVAYLKEFIVVVEDLVKRKKFEGDYQLLAMHLEGLKPILEKVEKNGNILVILETAISAIQAENPLLLEGSKQNESEYFTFDTTLAKMNVEAFNRVVDNLYRCSEEDFYKVIERLIQKGEFFRLKSNLPMYLAIMNGKVKKGKKEIDLPEFLARKTKETIEAFDYYPTSITSIDGLYELYVTFLSDLVKKGTISEEWKEVLRFRFLQATYMYSDTLAQLFVDESECVIPRMYELIQTKDFTKVTDLLSNTIQYSEIDELYLLNDCSDSRRETALNIKLVIEKGKVEANLENKMIKKRTGWKEEFEERGVIEDNEYRILEYIWVILVKPFQNCLKEMNVTLSDSFGEWYADFEHRVVNMKLDTIDKEVMKFGKYYFFKQPMYADILEKRVPELITDEEIQLMTSSKEALESVPFDYLKTEDLKAIVERMMKNKWIDVTTDEGIRTLYQFNVKQNQTWREYIVDVITNHYDAETIHMLSSFVEEDEKNIDPKRKVKDVKTSMIFEFFSLKMKNKTGEDNFTIHNF